ncbi:hypothetical protein MTQ10_02085 [Streptomyces sp. XM83C]|uniref:hypothetical protein n=1 Tax=unclassified Streptomyces TaxID=2593676 RepID=UPI001FF9A228|nr:hypothetical protein [Streptomyces sp. XM83C]MCK1818424.1 hypothetical protein [Streptomyces sp. XM83C]
MARTRVLFVSAALCAGALLGAAGCSGTYLEMGQGRTTPPVTPKPARSGAAPAPSPAAVPALTPAQAQAALVTAADLGGAWGPSRGTALWRDGLLKAGTTAPDCQRLLDLVYADEMLGADPRALVGLDEFDTEAQLRYQVSAAPRADVDRVLAWMRTLPQKCARFDATTLRSGVQSVQVLDYALPAVGDDRQGLRLTLSGPVSEETGEGTVLTMDVVVVRVGDDAFAVTNGSLGDLPTDATQTAVQIGAQRLADVRRQGRVLV